LRTIIISFLYPIPKCPRRSISFPIILYWPLKLSGYGERPQSPKKHDPDRIRPDWDIILTEPPS
jgi:hypothetical protein